MVKKKVVTTDIPEILPEDTSPVVIDPLHEGVTMQVRIAPGNTKPISEVNSSLNETQAMKAVDFEQEINLPPPDGPSTQPLKVNKPKRWRWVFLGVLLVFIGAGVGGWIGYIRLKAGFRSRKKILPGDYTQFQWRCSIRRKDGWILPENGLSISYSSIPNFPVSLQNWLK